MELLQNQTGRHGPQTYHRHHQLLLDADHPLRPLALGDAPRTAGALPKLPREAEDTIAGPPAVVVDG